MLVNLAFTALSATVPYVAWRIAVLSTGWVDLDNNGMLDGMVMGQYDPFDMVLPSAVRWAVGLTILVLVAHNGATRPRTGFLLYRAVDSMKGGSLVFTRG